MGSVNIDNTGSGAAVTLSSNGTSLLLNGSAIGGGSSTLTITSKTSAYTVVSGDNGSVINCSGATSFTLSLTAAASLGSGFNVTVWNNTTTTAMQVTIDPNGAETIDGLSTLVLNLGEGAQIVCDGTNWQTGFKKTMRGHADNVAAATARPVASGANSVAVGGLSTASGSQSASFGYNSSATGLGGLALGYGASAGNSYSVAICGTTGANGSIVISSGLINGAASNGTYSSAIGGNSSSNGSITAQSGCVSLGGSYATGFDSFATSIVNNTNTYGANGNNSAAISCFAKASGSGAVAIGYQSTASGAASIVIGSAANSGVGSTASGINSVAVNDGALASGFGKYAYTATRTSTNGDAQYGLLVLRATTTGSTVVLTSDGAAAGSTNQLILSSNKVMAVTGTLIGKQTGSANIAAYTITATVVNNGGTLTVPTGTLTLIGSDTITLTTSPTLTADTGNLALKVTSGAKTGTSINWVCTLQATELLFA